MSRAKTRPVFSATHRVVLMVETEIVAASFEDAIVVAKSLKLDDLVDVIGEIQDGNAELQGVSWPEKWSIE